MCGRLRRAGTHKKPEVHAKKRRVLCARSAGVDTARVSPFAPFDHVLTNLSLLCKFANLFCKPTCQHRGISVPTKPSRVLLSAMYSAVRAAVVADGHFCSPAIAMKRECRSFHGMLNVLVCSCWICSCKSWSWSDDCASTKFSPPASSVLVDSETRLSVDAIQCLVVAASVSRSLSRDLPLW